MVIFHSYVSLPESYPPKRCSKINAFEYTLFLQCLDLVLVSNLPFSNLPALMTTTTATTTPWWWWWLLLFLLFLMITIVTKRNEQFRRLKLRSNSTSNGGWLHRRCRSLWTWSIWLLMYLTPRCTYVHTQIFYEIWKWNCIPAKYPVYIYIMYTCKYVYTWLHDIYIYVYIESIVVSSLRKRFIG